MRTVVVPLDGSSGSLTAARPAYAIAQRCAARVVLVTGGVDATAAASAGSARERLDGLAHRFEELADTTTVVSGEGPIEAISSLVGSHEEAVVAMATHGRRGLSGTVLGSVATEVLRSCGGPVLLVGPSCRSFALPRERAELVVCVEGSVDGEVLAAVAAEWCASLGLDGRVTTVTVPEESVTESGFVPDEATASAEARLEPIRRAIEQRGGTGVTSVLYGADPARSITEFAARNEPASLVVASHCRRGLAKAVLGSVAARIVHDSPVPVLVVPLATAMGR